MSSRPIFRNPDKFQVLPLRDYLRGEKFPSGKGGLVVEDLDLVLLRFGPLVGRDYDADGKIAIVESKNKGYTLPYAQIRTFRLLDKLLRSGDPKGEHYAGFYVLNWDNENNTPVAINYRPCTQQEFDDWVVGKLDIPPLRFK